MTEDVDDAPAAGTAVDLVVFELAGARFAADLAQVRRIDSDDPGENVGPVLGEAASNQRTLVFSPREGYEFRLSVDEVVGVERVAVTSLRRMPGATRAPAHLIGAWLDGEQPVLLVDLHAMDPHRMEEGRHGH